MLRFKLIWFDGKVIKIIIIIIILVLLINFVGPNVLVILLYFSCGGS